MDQEEQTGFPRLAFGLHPREVPQIPGKEVLDK